MEELRDILFKEGEYNEKKAYIDAMSTDALLKINGGLVREIINCTNPKDKEIRIRHEFTPEKYWNSYVEEFFIINDSVYVMLYIQNTKTDTSKDEKFHVFKLGAVRMQSPGYIYLNSWHYRTWLQTLGADPEVREVWLSVKFTGPKYVKGSKSPNRVSYERVFLVKP